MISTDFDSMYSLGNVVGQNDWVDHSSAGTQFQIVNTGCVSGMCLELGSGNDGYIKYPDTGLGIPLTSGEQTFKFKFTASFGSNQAKGMQFTGTNGAYNDEFHFRQGTDTSKIRISALEWGGGGATLFDDLDLNIWYDAEYTWDWNTCQFSLTVDGDQETWSGSGGLCAHKVTNVTSAQLFLHTGAGGTTADSAVMLIDDFGASAPVFTHTRFDSLAPQMGTTTPVATSTAFLFNAIGYVSTADISSSTEVYMRWRQQTGMGQRGNGNLSQYGEFTFPITASGAFDVSTTTSVQNTGVYAAYWEIRNCSFSLFGYCLWHSSLKSVVRNFVVGEATQTEISAVENLLDTNLGNITGVGNTEFQTSTTTTTFF